MEVKPFDLYTNNTLRAPRVSLHSPEKIAAALKAARESSHASAFSSFVVSKAVDQDEGFFSSVVHPSVDVKIDKVLKRVHDDSVDVIKKGVLNALVGLENFGLSFRMPPVLRQRPLKQRKEYKNLRWRVDPFPKSKTPIVLQRSAQVWAVMNKTAMKQAIDLFRAIAVVKGRRSLSFVMLGDIVSPFPRNFYSSPVVSMTADVSGVSFRDLCSQFLSTVDSDVHVIWGDSGSFIPMLSSISLDYKIFFYSTDEYPIEYYDKYLSFVKSATNRARFKLIHAGSMGDLVAAHDFSQDIVIHNFVPYQFVARRTFAVCKDVRVKAHVAPPLMSAKSLVAYHSMFYVGRGTGKVRLRDYLTNRIVSFMHHRSWVDSAYTPRSGIPLAHLMRVKGAAYDGSLVVSLSSNDECVIPDDLEDFFPVRMPMQYFDFTQVYMFSGQSLHVSLFAGVYPGVHGDRRIDGMIVYLCVDGVYRIVDADIGYPTYVERYVYMLIHGYPVVSIDPAGSYCVAYDAHKVGDVYLVYSVDDVVQNDAIVSSAFGYGLAYSGGILVYDGESKFFRQDISGLTGVKGDLPYSWRVRYKKNEFYQFGNFFFKVLDDNAFGFSMVDCIDAVDCPDDWRDELRSIDDLVVVDPG